MADEKVEGAVRYFSDNAEHFHALYRAQPEYHERLQLWLGLLERFATRGGFSVDMGCGPGIFSFYLASLGGRVVGVDGAPEMIASCERQRLERGLENVSFVQALLPDVHEAELASADLVISSSVIEYVTDLDPVLSLFSRTLKPSGTLIVSMPNVLSLSRTQQRLKYRLTGDPEIYGHIKHFSLPVLLERRVRPLGLRMLESHYYTHYTRLAKLARTLRLPRVLSEDLFVAVFKKQ